MKEPDSQFERNHGSTIASGRRKQNLGQQKLTPALVCFEGAERGKSFAITRAQMRIGRSTEADIQLNDELASRQHALVHYDNIQNAADEPECYLEDLQSRNGTEVNGKLLTTRLRLRTLDRIQIGTTIYGYVVKDESEVRVQESFFELATQDALTGLNNRRQFMALMNHQISRAQRAETSTALLVIDVDDFKSINDTHGHDIGDRVLTQVAHIIRDCCRAEELPARWGGEEFVVLLPDCDAQGATVAAERIRISIESSVVSAPNGPLKVTVSIGGAAMLHNPHFNALFRLADQELLQAKREGKNRTLVENVSRISNSISTAGY